VLLLAFVSTESLAVIARQGLSLRTVNKTATVKFDRVKQIVKPCDEACKKAGAWGQDSSCRTQCETEMYMCHDNNHTVATTEFQACSDKVVTKYETYQGPTTGFLRGAMGAKFNATRQIVKPCENACFKAGEPGDESSCFTMCEAEMYKCHDHNHTVATEEFQACHDEVVAKYEKYHAELLQTQQIVKPCEEACAKAGEPGDESSCFTMCEAEMYKCHDHNHTVAIAEFQTCHDEVVAKYEKYHAELLLASRSTSQNSTHMYAATFDKASQIVKPCEDACFKAGEAGDESSCFTMCEAEMYKCHDHNHTVATAEFQSCHDEVVAKYEKYHAELLQTKQIVKPCEEACAKAGEPGDESSCFSMCETEMYKCHDHNHTVATVEFQACHDEVVAKYEQYHADKKLLFATKNRTLTSGADKKVNRTQQIVKPCEEACFKADRDSNQQCQTDCEVAMYKCHDKDQTVAVNEFKACQNDVMATYEKYGK
jgi:hypothetical protein